MTLSVSDVLDNIANVFEELDGEEIARIHNSICSTKIEYKGDSMFEIAVSQELIKFLRDRGWDVESFWDDDSECTMYQAISPEDGAWSPWETEAEAWNDILDQDEKVALAWDQAR